MAKKSVNRNEMDMNINRCTALNIAVQVNAGNSVSAQEIVRNAETYFQFLTK